MRAKPKNDPKWLRPFRYKLEDALARQEIEPYTANAALEFLKTIGSRTAKHLWFYTYSGNAEFTWGDNNEKFLSFEFKDIGSREQILHFMRLLSKQAAKDTYDYWAEEEYNDGFDTLYE